MKGIATPKKKLKYTKKVGMIANWLLHHDWQYYSECYNRNTSAQPQKLNHKNIYLREIANSIVVFCNIWQYSVIHLHISHTNYCHVKM